MKTFTLKISSMYGSDDKYENYNENNDNDMFSTPLRKQQSLAQRVNLKKPGASSTREPWEVGFKGRNKTGLTDL